VIHVRRMFDGAYQSALNAEVVAVERFWGRRKMMRWVVDDLRLAKSPQDGTGVLHSLGHYIVRLREEVGHSYPWLSYRFHIF